MGGSTGWRVPEHALVPQNIIPDTSAWQILIMSASFVGDLATARQTWKGLAPQPGLEIPLEVRIGAATLILKRHL
jgi:hypothetical protein